MPPKWWNEHGMKMQAMPQDGNNLTIKNNVAKLMISRLEPMFYQVLWQIIFGNTEYGPEIINGQIFMTSHGLAAAFGLAHVGCPSWLFKDYGADAGGQGQFVRRGQFLNIPGPGTGNDGDPNISIFISDDIKQAIDTLLSTS